MQKVGQLKPSHMGPKAHLYVAKEPMYIRPNNL